MVGKVQLVSGLADWTAHSITQDADSWKRYLATASRLYKYSFDDQLLIYAQRPGAKACASMELWNDRMHRWVKRGSKGIALLRQREGGRPYLTYVFEVSDTRPVQGARELNLWRMGEEHWPAVLETLERQYGAGGSQELGKRLMEVVEHTVEDACPEYLRDMAYDRGRNPGEGRGGREAEGHFREVLCASVQYTVLTRCGLNAEDYLESDSLSGIQAFSDPGVLHHLGNAVSTVSMGILQEIGRTIRRQDRETAEKLQRIRKEKEERQKEEKPLENNEPIRYTETIEEFNTLKRESRERSGEYGESDIQEMRGIPDPRTGSGRGGRDGRNALGKVRDAAPDIPHGKSPRDVYFHAADGKADAPSAADRRTDTGAGRPDGGGADEAGRSGRESESTGPDGMGAGSQQADGAGGGRGASGDRVQVASEKQEKEQETAGGDPAVSASGHTASLPDDTFAFQGLEARQFPSDPDEKSKQLQGMEGLQAGKGSFLTEEEIDRMLLGGSGVSERKLRICSYFLQGHDAKERADFLQAEYGDSGHVGAGYVEQYDSKGIKLTPPDGASGFQWEATVKRNWNQVQKRIGELIDAGRYLNPAEKAYLPEYEKICLARSLYTFFYCDPNKPRRSREKAWDIEAGERDFRPMLDSPKYCRMLYEDMVETFAVLTPEDGQVYQIMQKAMEDMAAYQRGEYSLFTPLTEEALQAERRQRITEREGAEEKEPQGIQDIPPKEKEPAGELETAARALAKKQKGKVTESPDGQLAFDFSAFDTDVTVQEEPVEKEAKEAGSGQEQVEEQPMPVLSSQPRTQPESRAEKAMEPASVAKSPAELYRETLSDLSDKVRQGSLFSYLRDRETDYDSAAAELDQELGFFIEEIAESQPDLYDAFHSLPMFREWMVEDILESVYQDMVTDSRDAIERHRGESDAPEWVAEAADTSVQEIPEAQADGEGHLNDGNSRIIAQEESQPVSGEMEDSPEMEEAKRLIEDFCLEEYNVDSVDFSNPKEVGIAYGVTENGSFEVQVNVDLIHFSLSQLVDGECVEKRQYGSLRELIDGELAFLEYDQLIYLEPHIEERLESDLNEKIRQEEMQGAREGVFSTETQSIQSNARREGAPDRVEIEGGQVVTPGPVEIYDVGLPYEIGIQKLHIGPDRNNLRIMDDDLGTGGQKTKYQNNLAAIRTLKQIEAENRPATREEQEILSKYVGWGGLSQAFEAGNEKWGKEYAELKEILTLQEYESARSTVLNAYYTTPVVIRAMYEAVRRMDFMPGNILEPSCGIGNFFGLVPEEFEKAKLYGVELDSLTGRIAGQLYQKADITVGGFETADHPDDFFDLAVGNVPFGQYKVHDRQYDRQKLFIHDYFFMKTLDKVRPGGVVAFITSKGTMDKANGRVREALAQKADLLGAIRLPNNAFSANAGTDVTSDILFFQKRGSAPEKLPDWVEVGQTEDGVPLNNYFLQHPEMVLGRMAFWKNMYGNATETACLPLEGVDLKEQLAEAVTNIGAPDQELLHMDAPGQEAEGKQGLSEETIPADPHVRNFSFTEKGGKLYFRENSRMKRVEPGKTPAARIRGMIGVRDSARRLIDLQLNGADDGKIEQEQARLNTLYDSFQKKYGLLNSDGNRLAFRQDSSYPLLCSLEVLDEEGNLQRKADMFTKRTIRHRQSVTSVDTAVEALGVSIGERACVDLGFMASLMGGSDKIPQILSDLKGIIFKDPDSGPAVISEENTDWHKGWQTADEYLSGNVRKKLETARRATEKHPEFAVNVEALLAVQPKDLTAPEISVRIGAPWIDTKYYKQFLFELLQTPERLREGKIDVLYSDATCEWRIKGKSEDSHTNTRVHATYGTKRINAYEIFQASLNQKSVQIFDTYRDAEGKETRVLNEKETAVAQQKQEAMKEAFRDWIFKDPERRTDLCAVYNKLFNSTRPREYDGQHITFNGMNPEIRLEPHQRNAVARMLYGRNTLLAHVVGAGKTYEMIAAAMESRRLGLCRKSIMVVPNHLTEQWGGDFLTLYPGAKVLVATKKDFEPKNRKKFCARISTGDYDAVIIGHSQFEKIPISPDRQAAVIKEQIREIMEAIAEAKADNEEKFTVKQMEKTKKNLEDKIKKLYDKKKDDTVTFEELGVDRLFVDEAHGFKNLYMHTKMRNVAGITQSDARKSSDMFAKCRYMDELTGGRGVIFATGTPVSNSMVELYTMMRYLQYDMLEEGYRDSAGKTRSLKHFDNWAATFGEQVSAVELKPEGTGFRLKTRFSRFYNLPELMNRWKEAADIQTADMLKLPVPEAEYVTIQTEPSEAQKAMVQSLAERAEKIRKERIDPRIDNMLKITSDGRKLALDQRIMNPLLPDDPGSKVNACVDNVFKIWQESAGIKGTQLIFSDLSTPKGKAEPKKEGEKESTEGDGPEGEAAATEEETAMEASVYEDIRKKLIAKGIPPQEIAFIHDAHTEVQKADLFTKVRNGQVRVLLGSTQKMGAGTNVQTRLLASHDLDCPWRPADLEQRAGRIVRRGNENKKVTIFRYVTKGTFDAYTWGLVESKQKFIGQIMTSKSPARSIEDVDATALSYAEVKMLATGDTRIKEKMDLDIQVTKLKMLKANHQAQQYEMQDRVRGYYPNKIKETQLYIDCLEADLPVLKANPAKEDAFAMTVMGTAYTERKEAGKAIVAACRLMDDPGKELELGQYRGFPMKLMFDGAKFKVTMKQHLTYTAELSDDVVGNIARINNVLERIPQSLEDHRENMERLHKELESAKEEAERPFAQEAELQEKSARLAELNAILDNEEKRGGDDPEEEKEQDAGDGGRAENAGQQGCRVASGEDRQSQGKPSILKALKEYEPQTPAKPGMGRRMEREVAG